jgi:hypothetical protein
MSRIFRCDDCGVEAVNVPRVPDGWTMRTVNAPGGAWLSHRCAACVPRYSAAIAAQAHLEMQQRLEAAAAAAVLAPAILHAPVATAPRRSGARQGRGAGKDKGPGAGNTGNLF